MATVNMTNYGNINISSEAIASLTGNILKESYGVVGLVSKHLFKDGIADLLNKENYSKGVIVRFTNNGLEVDVYIIVSYGVRISEVVSELQKNIKYILEKTLKQDIYKVNIFVQGVRKID